MREEIKKQIEDARKSINSLGEQQEEIYNSIKHLVNPKVEDFLWDYCFNCYDIDDQSEFTVKTREIIYGN
jgi:hypothetical protein